MSLQHRDQVAAIEQRRAACVEIIRDAGDEARRGFEAQRHREMSLKGPQDFLTETDLAVEKLIRARLSESFPDDGFLGEETGGDVSGSFWVVDPIDGTANFARGIAHYAIVMAFVTEGRIELGAIYNVEMDELYLATRGNGATKDGQSLKCAETSRMDSSSVELGWSNRLPNRIYVDIVAATLEAGANARRVSSGALGLAFVADGRSDGYAEIHMNAWDCLAGLLIVEEAGGVVSGTALQPDLKDGGSVLAVAPGVADAFSAATSIPLT